MSEVALGAAVSGVVVADWAQRLRGRRNELQMRLDDAAYLVRQRLPQPMGLSRETLARLERGQVPEDRADPVVIAALADVYGCPVAELSPLAATHLSSLRQLLDRLVPEPRA